ncbi:hypothetical protein [Methanobrevibacter sp.]|uniref:hypothetical protein n=1 Tax=Methanobrevibacter sp. TaxID=66852 RepID=UPI0038691DCB
MEKKSILMILVILVLIFITGASASADFNTQAKVGSSTFDLPNGFHTVDSDKSDLVNITNGYDTLLLKECGTDNITKYVKTYVKNLKEDNKTVKVKNFTVDDIMVYKSVVVNDTDNLHYWFNHDGKVYVCYTHNGNDKTDSIVKDLIKSSK